MKRRFIKACVSLSLAACVAACALAEVSVEVDANGKYMRTIYIEKTTGKTLKIWTTFGNKPTVYPLNIYGDINGDLKPAIKENPYTGNTPYVVWPYYDGNDYEIVFSKWANGKWSPIDYLEYEDNIYDDLDPAIDFDGKGRAYACWWRNEEGRGTIYVSCFLKARWMLAYPISEEGVDSWDPEILINDRGEIEVTYFTTSGPVKKYVVIHLPDTITDDIDPFGTGVVDVNDSSSSGDVQYGQ